MVVACVNETRRAGEWIAGAAKRPEGRERAVPAFAITVESDADRPAREALLDRAMGPKRKRKSSEKLRRGRLPAEGLAFAARCNLLNPNIVLSENRFRFSGRCSGDGALVGTVRLWDVRLGVSGSHALLLGPLAVEPGLKGAGIGTALMNHAIFEAARRGHRAILLVGDPGYYARFGFSSHKTNLVSMPGPYERERLLALELTDGALDGAHGVLEAAGRKVRPEQRECAA